MFDVTIILNNTNTNPFMYACSSFRICTCDVYDYKHKRMYMCIDENILLYTACIYIYIFILCDCLVNVYMYIINIQMHIWIYVCVYIYTYMNVYVLYTFIYIYIYIQSMSDK